MSEPVARELAEGSAISWPRWRRDAGSRDRAWGSGELLTAHRALEAVDCTSREDARLALRAVLCSERGDLEQVRARVRRGVRRRARAARTRHRSTSSEESSGTCCRAPGCPATAPPPSAEERSSTAVPAAWSDVELLRHKDFASYTDAGDGGRAGADRAAGPARADAAFAPHAALAPARAHARTCGGWCAARCARRGSRSTGYWRAPSRRPRPMVLVLRRVGIDDPVRADAAPVPARVGGGAPAGRGVRVRDAADPDHARTGRPRPRSRAGARRRGGGRLLPVARGSARRWRR